MNMKRKINDVLFFKLKRYLTVSNERKAFFIFL